MKLSLQKLPMKWDSKQNTLSRNGFTLIEMSVALVILGMIIASVFVIINRAVETIGDWQTKIEAFEIARENMEKLLAQKSLSDTIEYGTSETNPDIKWETTVESFYEPVSNKMWMRAICISEFTDSKGEEQKVELTHWLTSLSKKQIMQIMEQQQREEQFSESTNDETQPSDQENPQQGDNQQGQNSLGPPPEGYTSWDDVPAEQLFKILENSLKE